LYKGDELDYWDNHAKCKGMDTDLWFPPRDKQLYKPIADQAKAICFGKDGEPECPVRKECLIAALKIDEQHGIRGGLSHRERNALQRKAKRHKMTVYDWIEQEG
jgi:WhiB family redox-sensing transcriptional regulator